MYYIVLNYMEEKNMNKQIKHDDGGHGKICDQNYDCKNCEYYKEKIRKEEEYRNE